MQQAKRYLKRRTALGTVLLVVVSLLVPIASSAMVCLNCPDPRIANREKPSAVAPGTSPPTTKVPSAALPNFATAPGKPTTLQATLTYADSNNVIRPIRLASVEVWRFGPSVGPIWAWSKAMTAKTDGAGILSATVPFEKDVVYSLRVLAENDAVVVWPKDGARITPFWVEAGSPGKAIEKKTATAGATLNFSWHFGEGFASNQFNIAEVALHGRAFAEANRAPDETDAIPRAGFQQSDVLSSFYNAAIDTVVLDSSHPRQDFTILHEYGHFLQEQIGSLAWIVAKHDGCDVEEALGATESAEQAWLEGFASWFALAVAVDNPAAGLTGFASTTGSDSFPFAGFETPDCPAVGGVTGDEVEMFVAGALWDLTDAVNVEEPADTQSGHSSTIFGIMDKELDTGAFPTINAFHDAWVKRGLAKTSIDPIFTLNQIPIPGAPATAPPTTAKPPVTQTETPPSASERPPAAFCGKFPTDPRC